MSAPQFMPLYIGDYMGDAGHLKVMEHGAYLLLLMAAWRRGGKLPNDHEQLMVFARCNKRQWDSVKTAVLGFFEEEGESLIQRRLRREITKYENEIEKRRISGKLGGEAKARKNNGANVAHAKQVLKSAVANPSKPEPEPEEEAKASSVSEPSVPRPVVKMRCEEFEDVWRLWPQKGRSAKSKALALWKAKGSTADPSAMLAAVRRYLASPDAKKDAGAFVPALERWLRDRLESWLERNQDAPLFGSEKIDWGRRYELFDDLGHWEDAWGAKPLEAGHEGPRKAKTAEGVAA